MKVLKNKVLTTLTITTMLVAAGTTIGAYAETTLKQISAYQNAAINVTVNGQSIDMSSEVGTMYPIV